MDYLNVERGLPPFLLDQKPERISTLIRMPMCTERMQ